MARILLASIIGAVVAFGWGFIAWPTLNLYKFAFNELPNETATVEGFKGANLDSALYVFPAMPKDGHDKAAQDAWSAKHKAGPMGMLMYHKGGADPADWHPLAHGFGINLVACFLMACLMVATRQKTWGMRFTVSVLMAAFAVMVSHAYEWNWFHFPDPFVMAMAADTMVTWLLAGVFVAMIAKPPVTA